MLFVNKRMILLGVAILTCSYLGACSPEQAPETSDPLGANEPQKERGATGAESTSENLEYHRLYTFSVPYGSSETVGTGSFVYANPNGELSVYFNALSGRNPDNMGNGESWSEVKFAQINYSDDWFSLKTGDGKCLTMTGYQQRAKIEPCVDNKPEQIFRKYGGGDVNQSFYFIYSKVGWGDGHELCLELQGQGGYHASGSHLSWFNCKMWPAWGGATLANFHQMWNTETRGGYTGG
jgi:hypothetical protein